MRLQEVKLISVFDDVLSLEVKALSLMFTYSAIYKTISVGLQYGEIV